MNYTNQDEIITQVMADFIASYIPCETIQECDHKFTTDQIIDMVKNFSGIEASQVFIFEYMQEANFKYEQVVPLKFYWLLKDKP